MKILDTKIPEVKIIEPDVFGDHRGWFMETWSQPKYESLHFAPMQDNESFTAKKGTLRGIHFQQDPMAQAKIVRVVRGAVMDVAVDLRKGSPTYLQWVSVELSAENKRQFYIPRGFGHGFVTLTDDVDFCYKADNLYDHPSDRSIRFDDPAIDVDWGVTDPILSDKDKNHVDRSIEDPGVFLQTNIIGTATMMDACRKYGIQRYHQVSTDEVYGDLPLDRPDLFFTEETPIHTSSPYSSSKAAADLLVQAYHRTYGLPVTISRCSNNYGPYHFPEKLIPLMDWLYVEDHCRAIDLIIHKGRVGEVYNVGGHNEMRNIDIVKLICKELGKPESLIVHVADRKGHDMRYAIDPTKIHNELGWLPETKFADGIKKTIDWYLNHREWWETIISGEYQDYYEKMYGNR